MAIRAVIFDLDNTLTHRDLTVQAYSRYLDQFYAAALTYSQTEKMIEIVRRIDRGGYPLKALLTQPSIGGSVAEALIQELSWQQAPSLEELSQFWFREFGRNAVAMPEAEALLQHLKKQGYRLAVVSNGGQQTRMAILAGLGFQDYFELIMSSEQAGVAKPAADIFLQTAHHLGCSPEECLFIGDHPVNDVLGAAQVGMQAVWLEGFHTGYHIDVPHFRIQHLTQLPDVLARID